MSDPHPFLTSKSLAMLSALSAIVSILTLFIEIEAVKQMVVIAVSAGLLIMLLKVQHNEKLKLHKQIEILKEKLKSKSKSLKETAVVNLELSEIEMLDFSSSAFSHYNYANSLLNSWQNLLLLQAPDFMRKGGKKQVDKWWDLHIENFPDMPEYLECISKMLSAHFCHKYSLCIKVVAPVNGYDVQKGSIDDMLSNLETRTLSRCISSAPRNEIDILLREQNIAPTLNSNSDFRSIIKSANPLIESQFCCNNLPERHQNNEYLNTNSELYKLNEKVFRDLGLEYDDEWTLPYKSALIVPICPSDNSNKKTLSGFLCADSYEIDAFDHDLSLMIMRSAADNLFGVLSLLDKRNENPSLN